MNGHKGFTAWGWTTTTAGCWLLRHLIARRRHRDLVTGLTRAPLPPSLDALPQDHRLYLGQGSVTDATERMKYVDLSEPLFPYTFGELGREWLNETYRAIGAAEPRPAFGMARNAAISPALYFAPGPTSGDWAYLDIAACYGSLLGRWPLDTGYIHALAVKAGTHVYRPAGPTLPVSDLLACKPLRLAAWGSIRGGKLQWRSKTGWHATQAADRLARPGLSALVLLAVHEIAWRAVHELGARMWLTDAAILPLARAFDFIDLLRTWGLRARIKGIGACTLTGLGAYRVGDRQSETFGRVTPGINSLLAPLPWRAI